MKKTGYMIAQNRMESTFFTASSSYDIPKWAPLKEGTIYATAELADKALLKLLKNGAYSARLVEASAMQFEFPDDGPNKNQAPITQTSGDAGADEMTAGQLSGDPAEDLNNGGDDDIEIGDDFDNNEDYDGEFGDEEQSPDDNFAREEDEQSLSPLEQEMAKGGRGIMPSGNGPVRESAKSAYRNTQGDVALTSSKNKSTNKGRGRSIKITDEEVREMRTMKKNGSSINAIYAKWPNIAESTIKKIINGDTRNSPACDIDEGIDTTVTKIKFSQDNRNERDTNFSKDIEPSYANIKIPRNVMRAIAASIKTYDEAAEFNNGRDDSQASMALTIVDALRTIEDCLKQGTQEGLTQAQIKITTFMNPITTNFPPEVIDYLYKSGRQPVSLKNIFYDKWNTTPKDK